MQYGCGILVIILAIVLALGKCQQSKDAAELNEMMTQMEREAKGSDSPKLPQTKEGLVIAAPSDPGASYRILRIDRMANGNLEVLSRRDGPSGTSFARREISCSNYTYRYLGEGDTMAQAEKDGPNPGEMSALTGTSASSDVTSAACTKGPG